MGESITLQGKFFNVGESVTLKGTFFNMGESGTRQRESSSSPITSI